MIDYIIKQEFYYYDDLICEDYYNRFEGLKEIKYGIFDLYYNTKIEYDEDNTPIIVVNHEQKNYVYKLIRKKLGDKTQWQRDIEVIKALIR